MFLEHPESIKPPLLVTAASRIPVIGAPIRQNWEHAILQDTINTIFSPIYRKMLIDGFQIRRHSGKAFGYDEYYLYLRHQNQIFESILAFKASAITDKSSEHIPGFTFWLRDRSHSYLQIPGTYRTIILFSEKSSADLDKEPDTNHPLFQKFDHDKQIINNQEKYTHLSRSMNFPEILEFCGQCDAAVPDKDETQKAYDSFLEEQKDPRRRIFEVSWLKEAAPSPVLTLLSAF